MACRPSAREINTRHSESGKSFIETVIRPRDQDPHGFALVPGGPEFIPLPEY